MKGMVTKMSTYNRLKAEIAKGWNTWNTRSVLSHVLLPEGLAINLGIKEYKSGYYLKEALIGRFGEEDEKIYPKAHAYDGSYSELNILWQGIELCIQSSVQGDDLVLLVTPIVNQYKPAVIVAEAGILWNRNGILSREGEVILARLPEKDIRIYAVGSQVTDPSVATQTPYLAIELSSVVGISIGKQRTLEEIKVIIAAGKLTHDKKKEKYGELSEAYNALQSSIAWDTIYEPQKDRVVTPVSRIWNLQHGGYSLFCWDTYFAAYMAAIDNKKLAYCNAIEITKEKTREGFVPNCAWGNGFSSHDRSQPPVGSLVVRELYRRYGDLWLLEELFDDLYEWNTWFYNNRSLKNHTMTWGSNPYEPVTYNYWESAGVGDTYGAALESGLDNSPMYDQIPFDKDRHILKLSDVGLTGLYLMDCEALADIAAVLNKTSEKDILILRAKDCKQGLKTLWDEESGIFLNKRTDTNEFSPRLSPTNFYALFSDEISKEQSERMLKEHFYNPEEFWGDYILPSISRNDSAFPDQDYWRGRIWAPMNFLVYLGLRKHSLADAQKALADKSEELILKEWLVHGHVHENYSAITGEGCDVSNSDKFYHWGSLLSLIALMEAGYMDGPEKPL